LDRSSNKNSYEGTCKEEFFEWRACDEDEKVRCETLPEIKIPFTSENSKDLWKRRCRITIFISPANKTLLFFDMSE